MVLSYLLIFATLLISVVFCSPSPQFHPSLHGHAIQNTNRFHSLKEEQCQSNSRCVPFINCGKDGLIIRDGSALINPRITPSIQCQIVSQPNVVAVCCRLSADKPTTPAQFETCSGDDKCVDHKFCSAEGQIITDGTDQIDVRLGHTKCYNEQYNIIGVCCSPSKSPNNEVAKGCGVRNYEIKNRIQNSDANNEASFGEFPWQGAIVTIDKRNNIKFSCGISLISSQYAVTAAHCLDEIQSTNNITLRFGEWQVNAISEPLPFEDIGVSEMHIHPHYNSHKLFNDIAVLKLIRPVSIQFHINTICLPGEGDIFTDGQECFSTGWGRDSFEGNFQTILKKTELPFVTHKKCEKFLKKTVLGAYYILDKSFSCAGGIANKDTCFGDGGGPLVCKNPDTNKYVLAGITAWGIGCGTGVPGVYVDVRIFRNWIDVIIAADDVTQPPTFKTTLAPLESCYGDDVCVDHHLCNAEGKINIDGSSIIGVRLGQTNCYQPNNKVGVCCSPKKPPIIQCPHNSICDASGGCLGQALNVDNQFNAFTSNGAWKDCSLQHGNTGICCLLPVLTQCEHSLCLPGNQCVGGTALNRINAFDTYSPTGTWRECSANRYKGVCCKQPILNNCHSGSECIDETACLGEALNSYNDFKTYNQKGSWRKCYLAGFNGVCCKQPKRIVLDYCPQNSECVAPGRCVGTPQNVGSAFESYNHLSECNLRSEYTETGVCCSHENIILKICPMKSECVGYGNCNGTALNVKGSFVNYHAAGRWSKCSLQQGLSKSGTCCIPKPPKYITANKCGIRNYNIDERIQNSDAQNTAAFGEFPWQGIIFTVDENGRYIYKCGISLISHQHAITAAHCVDKIISPSDIRLRFGEWQINSMEEPLTTIDVNVSKVDIHSDFVSSNLRNDVAVLTLSKPVSFQFHINTICLPEINDFFARGQKCFTTGWGKDSFDGNFQHILKKVELPLVKHQSCQNLLKKTRLGEFFELHSSFTCAGGLANMDACDGDGGGPLVCKNPQSGQYYLVGITAWGISCGVPGIPGVYVDVKIFHDWIDSIVKEVSSSKSESGYWK